MLKRNEISLDDLGKINGGSIVVSTDGNYCGLNCTNEYRINYGEVNGLSEMCIFAGQHMYDMSEKEILAHACQEGWITRL